jgi:hypothetical protein
MKPLEQPRQRLGAQLVAVPFPRECRADQSGHAVP